MGKVSGTIQFEEDDTVQMLPFGQWLLRTIAREAKAEGWATKRDSPSSSHLYLWDQAEETVGKNAQHFLDKEHLHLIDNGTDVDISTKHPQALNINPNGTYEKRTAKDKEPQHLTGTKALNRGDSLPITICTANAVPDEVIQWQKDLIATLRDSTLTWLRRVATKEQIREFTTN